MTNMFLPETPDESTATFIQCAFPHGLSQEEYFPLLFILTQDMSFRAASSFVGMLLGKGYIDIYNDAIGVNNDLSLRNSEIVAHLKQRILRCGYEKWLDE